MCAMSLKGKAKAAAAKKARETFPKTAKAVDTAREVSNAAKSVVNGQCGHCRTALKNSRCPEGHLG